MKQTKQMSESIRLGMLLAFSGGFMDAYSYIQRDQVFANAQTGNILLLGVNLSEGNLPGALYYGIILCFVFGAVTGNIFVGLWHEKAILCSSALLLVAFTVMFVDGEKETRKI